MIHGSVKNKQAVAASAMIYEIVRMVLGAARCCCAFPLQSFLDGLLPSTLDSGEVPSTEALEIMIGIQKCFDVPAIRLAMTVQYSPKFLTSL